MRRVDQLFDGEPVRLPQWREPGGSWVITVEDAGAVAPPPIRHGLGYDEFVVLAAQYGTGAERLFDFWAFAHFIRAHRERFRGDPGLTSSAVVFFGNVCIANHPECYWTGEGPSLAVESARRVVNDEQTVRSEPAVHRYLAVGDTVPAILEASEDRFLEFRSVVDAWRPGAPSPQSSHQPHRDRDGAPSDH